MSRVALVKPENARAVEDMLIRAGQSGQLTQRVDEPKLIQLLEQLNETKKSTKITVENVIFTLTQLDSKKTQRQ